MSKQEKLKIAKEYIDKQIATMRGHGCALGDLSSREYEAMVSRAAKAITR